MKYAYIILGYIVALNLISYCFNHISPWAAIGIGAVILLITIQLVINKVKQLNKKEDEKK